MFDKPKVCGVHGVLSPEQTWIEKSKSGYSRRCKACRQSARSRWAVKRSGVVCPVHGQLDLDAMHLDGRCKECLKAKSKEYREANKDKIKEKNAKSNAKRVPKDPKRNHSYEYEKKKAVHGNLYSLHKQCLSNKITMQDYFDMVNKQDNKCAICFKEEVRICAHTKEVSRLSIDHCHTTKKVRALLCRICNTGIGAFKDDIEVMKNAIEYIRKHNGN